MLNMQKSSNRRKETLNLRRVLEERVREVEVLHQISESISANLNLDEVLKQIVEIVVQVTHADACLLYLLDSRREELILRASKNPHPKLIGRIRLEIGEGITGWVAKEKKPVAIPKNASEDPRFKFFHNLPEDRHQAFLSVPLIAKNEVIGVINVQHRRPHEHNDGELALLTTVAHQVGGAIENARLYEEMKKKAMQIETLSKVSRTIASDRYLEEILHLIVTMTAEMMDSKICSIVLLDEERQKLEIAATQSLSEDYRKKPPLKVGQSISGRVVKEKRPIALLDVTKEAGYMYPDLAEKEGLRSLLSVPMMLKDRVIGVINSYTSYEHRFTEEEIKLLQAVANQAAVAIENTKLMQRSLEMEEALETRKRVERAKGILAREKRIAEEEAFRLLQKQSMNTRRSMREIADAVILASQIKG
jgi:signal transduction protein with GAF and PtsI domain